MHNALRILNIEDKERDTVLNLRHLSSAGYELITDRVETAEAMKAALETRKWDVILCDYAIFNTRFTVCPKPSGVNGFWIKFIPSFKTP